MVFRRTRPQKLMDRSGLGSQGCQHQHDSFQLVESDGVYFVLGPVLSLA